MNRKIYAIGLLLLALFSCDDNTGQLGFNELLENESSIKGKLSFFDIESVTINSGKLTTKSDVGYVGKLKDNKIGEYEASYLAELYCSKGMTIPQQYKAFDKNGIEVDPDSPLAVKGTGSMSVKSTNENVLIIRDGDNKAIGNIADMQFILWYDKYYGDSLATNTISIYQTNKRIDRKDSNINPNNYYSKDDILGKKTFSVTDLSVSNVERASKNYHQSANIIVNKDKSIALGKQIIEQFNQNKELNNEIFSRILNGIYVKNEAGSQAVIRVDITSLAVAFQCYVTDSKTGLKLKNKQGKDSIYFERRIFANTPEVVLSTIIDQKEENLEKKINDLSGTYIQTPSGLITELTIPITNIYEQLYKDTMNIAKFSIGNFSETEETKRLAPFPENILLVRKNDSRNFFKEERLPNNIDSFVSKHLKNLNRYDFNNITNFIILLKKERDKAVKEIKEKGKITFTRQNIDDTTSEVTVTNIEDWEKESEWNKVVLIPIKLIYDKTDEEVKHNPELAERRTLLAVYRQLTPAYIKLKGGKNGNSKIRLEIITTDFQR